MKTKLFFLLVVISIFTIRIDAQIKIHSSGGISIGSIVDPGVDIISMDNPTMFNQIILPDLELTTFNTFPADNNLKYDFTMGYFQIKCSNTGLLFSTDRSFYRFDKDLWIQSTFYTSDINLKENILKIKDSGSSMEKIKILEGITYNLKEDIDKQSLAGFSAQELQKVLPNLVVEDDDGLLAVNYIGVIPYLVEAMKEQEERIKTLERALEIKQ